MQRWPNLFIVGAAKAGTTSLAYYLQQHPDVYVSPFKEPHHFSQIAPSPELRAFFPSVADEADYLKLFKDARQEKVLCEASTSYLWTEGTPERIFGRVPDAKIIILLREPVGRAYSHYLNDVREGTEKRPFLQAITEDYARQSKGWGVSHLYVDLGLYCQQVEKYLSTFSPDNVYVEFFETFVGNPVPVLESVFGFLDVDPGFAQKVRLEEKNAFAVPRGGLSRALLASPVAREVIRAAVPRSLRMFMREKVLLQKADKPKMDPEARAFLQEVYKNEAACLEALIGKEAPWGRRTA